MNWLNRALPARGDSPRLGIPLKTLFITKLNRIITNNIPRIDNGHNSQTALKIKKQI